MSVFLADINEKQLAAAVEEIKAVEDVGEVFGMKVDVSKVDEVVAMREKVLDEFGEVSYILQLLRSETRDHQRQWLMCQIHVLMNNAGVGAPCPAFSLTQPLSDLQSNWTAVLGVNLIGVINVAQVFAPHMARQENASAIICTGSKQGITCPP